MKEQAIEGRRDRAADIIEVGVYAVVILVVMLLWVYIAA
jgi:predicted nucleic acid-binding Zn ribbon protein